MFQKATRLAIALIIVHGLIDVESVPAQGQGRLPPLEGIYGILMMPKVQKELDIDASKLKEILQQAEPIPAEVLQALMDAKRTNTASLVAKQKVYSKYETGLKQLLSAEQFTRLKQLSWQYSRGSALFDPELIDTLKLTTEQETRLLTIDSEFAEKRRKNRGQSEKVRDEMRNERDRTLFEVLTEKQGKQFVELKGKMFEFRE